MKLCTKKTIVTLAAFLLFCVAATAGDVANFVSLGFSDNGTLYAFGEYGTQDESYQSYAELYLVDIAKNNYVKNGSFKTSPSTLTAHKDNRSVFLSLQNRAAAILAKHKITGKNEGRPIYVQTEKNKNKTCFEFRDFETNYTYTAEIHKETKELNAAFYITLDAVAPDGSKTHYTVGNKNYFRPSVKDYNIKKILISPKNDSAIFVIEKIVRDKTDDCVRYMVETMKF